MGHFLSFGPIGYTGETSQAHKLRPLGANLVMLGIAQNEYSSTFEVLKVRTHRNVVGHNMSWHPKIPASFEKRGD